MKDTELNKIKQDYENLSKQGQTLKEKIASQNKRYHNLSEQHCEQNKTINRFMSEMDKLKGQK